MDEVDPFILRMKRRHFLTLPLKLSSAAVLSGADQLTKSQSAPDLVFGVIADPQYADYPNKGTRSYRDSLRKMKGAMKEFNELSLNFVVTLGDVIDRDMKSFAPMLALYQQFKAPCRFVLGNHDFSVQDDEKSGVMKTLSMKQAYFSEEMGNWRMIYLDGTEVSTFRYPKDDPRTLQAERLLETLKKKGVKQALPWNGAIGKEQLAWLKRELEASKTKRQRVILFNHFPVCPGGGAHHLWNADEVTDVIATYPNVVAYMNGHNHRGHYRMHDGCHFLNLKGMVETNHHNAFALVRCYADRIEVDGFESEPDRHLALV